MFAITVQQPWAWAIIHGGKNVENRTRIQGWRRAQGERIAIHAGRRWSQRGEFHEGVIAACADLTRDARTLNTLGAVIGTVHVHEVHYADADADCDPEICAAWGEQAYREHGGQYRAGIVHLVLTDPRPCDPIDARGQLGLWRLDPDTTRLIETVRR